MKRSTARAPVRAAPPMLKSSRAPPRTCCSTPADIPKHFDRHALLAKKSSFNLATFQVIAKYPGLEPMQLLAHLVASTLECFMREGATRFGLSAEHGLPCASFARSCNALGQPHDLRLLALRLATRPLGRAAAYVGKFSFPLPRHTRNYLCAGLPRGKSCNMFLQWERRPVDMALFDLR